MTADLRAALRAIGPVIDADTTRPLYAPLLAAQPRDGVEVVTDLAYGPHERNVLDIYHPADGGSGPWPVVMYVHGGGFVHGDKTGRANAGYLFARAGFVAVHISYRLAPEHPWPAGAEDVAASYRWVAANVGSYGGDADRIALVGESAGGHHALTATFTSTLPVEDRPEPTGLALVSPVVDPRLDELVTGAPAWTAYFGDLVAKVGVVATTSATKSVLVTFAELDPVAFHVGASVAFAQLAGVDAMSAEIDMIVDHSHVSQLYAMNTSDDVLGPRLLRWLSKILGLPA